MKNLIIETMRLIDQRLSLNIGLEKLLI